jgi:hypothetical protein
MNRGGRGKKEDPVFPNRPRCSQKGPVPKHPTPIPPAENLLRARPALSSRKSVPPLGACQFNLQRGEGGWKDESLEITSLIAEVFTQDDRDRREGTLQPLTQAHTERSAYRLGRRPGIAWATVKSRDLLGLLKSTYKHTHLFRCVYSIHPHQVADL